MLISEEGIPIVHKAEDVKYKIKVGSEVQWLPLNKEVEERCSLFHPLRGVCGAEDPNTCGHCGRPKNEHSLT